MASPKIEVIFLYNEITGSPITGASFTFETYKDNTGANITPPSITEIGGGAYSFTPSFTTDKGIVYVLRADTSGATPKRVSRYMRPEDWNTDNSDIPTSTVNDAVSELISIAKGKWEIKTTGPDANRLILYDIDGVTVIKKFNLKDSSGNPTATAVFSREPV
ncbi:hypothetical protein EBZ38_12805 [bacterium]|nr:hypothetical protein [bacterium]